jgi:hypothetical protein
VGQSGSFEQPWPRNAKGSSARQRASATGEELAAVNLVSHVASLWDPNPLPAGSRRPSSFVGLVFIEDCEEQ